MGMNETRVLPWIAATALSLAFSACGGSISSGSTSTGQGGSSATTGATGSTGSTGATSSTTAGTGGSAGSTGTGPDQGCMPACSQTLACAIDSGFCVPHGVSPDCAIVSPDDKVHVCGVPLGAKAPEITRSSSVKENSGNGPPDLGCFSPASYPPKPGASQNVKLQGFVRIFSHGCTSKDVKIEVFTRTSSGANDGALGALVGAAVTTASDCQAGGDTSSSVACGTVYECAYTYTGVPTETDLVIKTSGALWAPVYEYSVLLRNDAIQGGAVTRDLHVVAADDYEVTAQLALGAPIPPGHGIILGEVHDCGDVRLLGAVADVDRQKKLIGYFDTNEETPLPDPSAAATTALGLYGAYDLTPGPVAVAAAGLSGGDIHALGFARATVFADAITWVTFRGPLPSELP